MVTEDSVRDSLRSVLDPHMKISLIEMGMVRKIFINRDLGHVQIDLAFPCIGCPAWTMIQEEVREAVESITDVTKVNVRVCWDEPWQKDDLDPEARKRIRTFGYQIFPLE